MTYFPKIGLEIHAELKTCSKMFCSCKNDPEEKRPNVNICPVCAGHPGTLPVANEEAVKKVIKTGLALNCSIAKESRFDRKNYFYPDLPKGYQISQYEQPLCFGGYLEVEGKSIRINRIHLEEDTGSLIHPEGTNYSLINFNRAGIPLMELVTEPDIVSGREARLFAEELQQIFRYLDVCQADMEKGQMRIEVNISLSSKREELGTKVEIKNLNSFKAVERAIEYEIQRQNKILESGKKIIQETRGWDEERELTFSQREKEKAHDYRYFPEPDLPPMIFNEEFIEAIRRTIPELPKQRRERLKAIYGLGREMVEVFVKNKEFGDYFEEVAENAKSWLKDIEEGGKKNFYKLASNYLISDIQGLLKGREFSRLDFKIRPLDFADFIRMIWQDEISSKIAKMVLLEMFQEGKSPSLVIQERGLKQINNEEELEKVILEVISKNQKVVNDYLSGKESALQFLTGQVMAITKGRAHPQKVQELLKKRLKP